MHVFELVEVDCGMIAEVGLMVCFLLKLPAPERHGHIDSLEGMIAKYMEIPQPRYSSLKFLICSTSI